MKDEIMKCVEENVFRLWVWECFKYDTKKNKQKICMLHFTEIRNICLSKDATKKRKPTKWEKIFDLYVIEKWLFSRL